MNSLIDPVEATGSAENSVMTLSVASTPSTLMYTMPVTVNESTAGLRNLGWGINAATGAYLEAYTEQIMKFDELVNCVDIVPYQSEPSKTIAEENSYDYLSTQSSQAGVSGGYAGFSGSLNVSFATSTSQKNTNYLATYTDTTALYQLTIRVADAPRILTDDFKKALYRMAVQEFYSKYGAYFTKTVVVGGSLSCSVQTEKTETYESAKLITSASASYDDGIKKGNADVSFTHEDATTKTSYQCNTGIVMRGGDLGLPKLGLAIDVDGWRKSIPDCPAVIAWRDSMPMWELVIDNEARRDELKGALDAYFSAPNDYLLPPLTTKITSAVAETKPNGTVEALAKTEIGFALLGGGASLKQAGDMNSFLTASHVIESDEPNQWKASGKWVHQKTNATLTAYAIGVFDPTDLLDIKVFSSRSVSGQKPTSSTSVPAGYVMTGGGVSTDPANTNGLMLTASYPDGSSTWKGAAKDHSQKSPGTIDVFAVGVRWRNPVGKPILCTEITSSKSQILSNPLISINVAPQAKLVGGGAFDNYNGYGNMLQESYPGPNPDSQWTASGHDCGQSNKAAVTAYAIGLYVLWNSKNEGPVRRAFGPGCLTPPEGCYA
jgi:hypothetical protein